MTSKTVNLNIRTTCFVVFYYFNVVFYMSCLDFVRCISTNKHTTKPFPFISISTKSERKKSATERNSLSFSHREQFSSYSFGLVFWSSVQTPFDINQQAHRHFCSSLLRFVISSKGEHKLSNRNNTKKKKLFFSDEFMAVERATQKEKNRKNCSANEHVSSSIELGK